MSSTGLEAEKGKPEFFEYLKFVKSHGKSPKALKEYCDQISGELRPLLQSFWLRHLNKSSDRIP